MPTYSCNFNDIIKLIGKGHFNPDKIESLMECAKSEVKGYDEETGELKLENNDTNRPDLWSSEGTARQIRNCHFNGKDSYPFFEKKSEPSDEIIVSENIRGIRPFIGGFRVTGITVDDVLLDQLIQAQEKLCDNYGRFRDLIAIGIYDASLIKLPIHYKGVKPEDIRFAPLDFEEKMNLREIIEKHPKGIHYGHLVKANTLFPIILDSSDRVLSFPPVINSNDLGCVKPGNTHLFVEVTGKERDAVTLAINILACNIHDRGGTIHPFQVKYNDGEILTTPWRFKKPLTLDLEYAESYVGEKINIDEFVVNLKAIGHEVNVIGENNSQVSCCPPPYRLDCIHSVDLIEDYCIAKGYNSFSPMMPEKFTIGKPDPLISKTDAIRELMIGMGFDEVITYILTSKDTMCLKMEDDDKPLEIANIMSESYSVVRSRLLPILLEIESKNPRAEYPHRIFEAGEVAVRDENSPERTTTLHNIAALLAHSNASFSELNSHLQALLYYLDIDYKLDKVEHPSFISGRAGIILIKGKNSGIIGEISPKVLENWGISCPCSAFEITVNNVF